jgi:MFS transporter, DHA1 family, tetracycline resistance protein
MAMKKGKPLLVLFFTIFLDLLGFGIIIPILPLFARELGATDLIIGLIAGVYSFMQFGFSSFWGGLSDRIGRRQVILISTWLMALSYLLLGWASSLLLLLIARVLAGFGAANISAAQAYISDISAPKDRAKNFGIIGAAFGLGFIVGPPIGGFLKQHYGIEWVGYSAMIFCGLNFLLAYFLLPESLAKKNSDKPIFSNPLKDIHIGLGRPGISELLSINFIFIVAFSMMHVTATLMWAEHYHFSEAEIGYIFAYIGLLAIIIQGGLLGWINQKMGENTLLISGNLLLCVGLVALPFVPEAIFMPLGLVVLAIISLGNSFLTPTINSMLSEISENHEKGKVLGTNQSFGSLARVFGPVIGGLLYGVQFQVPYLLSGALMMLAAYLSWKMLRKNISPQVDTN